MKLYFSIGAVLFLCMLLVPLAAMDSNTQDTSENQTEQTETQSVSNAVTQTAATTENEETEQVISVFLSKANSVVTVDMFDYTVGALAAEMPAAYHEQALRAQAVACYTYALNVKNSKTLENADISDSDKEHQGYLDEAAQKAKWGDSYEQHRKKMEAAVKEVYGKYLAYDGKPAKTVYHALNSGSTESAENVWSSAVPYLTSVVSDGDKLSPDYCASVAFTSEQFTEKVAELEIKTSGDKSTWIGEAKTTGTGTVQSILVCGKEVTGTQLRSAFALKSAAFTLAYKDGIFTFKTYGNGHMVGMSQYGADYMARQGSSYEEILLHYYPGTTLV